MSIGRNKKEYSRKKERGYGRKRFEEKKGQGRIKRTWNFPRRKMRVWKGEVRSKRGYAFRYLRATRGKDGSSLQSCRGIDKKKKKVSGV